MDLLALVRAPVELAEAEVAVGDEGAHAELAGERQRLAVVGFSVLRAGRQRDVTGEAEGVGLAGPSPQPAAERQCLSGVAGGLVELPGREVSNPREEKNAHLGDEILTTELFDGARDQRERFVSTAGKGVGGTEGRGDARYPEGDLPRSAEVVASLEDPGRAWEIPAPEVGVTECVQCRVQC
jgi:hypothetical protein